MEHAIIPTLSVEDLKKHLATFQSYSEGGEHREAFIGRQETNFTTADANQNGHVERTEFPTLISTILEFFNLEPTEQNLNELFTRVDKDADGKISHDEYFEWLNGTLAYLAGLYQAELTKRGE